MKELKDILDLFQQSNIEEMDLEREGWKVRLKKSARGAIMTSSPVISMATSQPSGVPMPPVSAPSGPAPVIPPVPGASINSPMVGTFYRAPDPDAPLFVQVGDTVSEGQVLCIIEAMKLMNEIKAEARCKILEILVENGKTVEFGQPIFLIEKLS